MMRLRNVPLPKKAQDGLRTLQLQIDGLGSYDLQVAAAKDMFPKKNTVSNAVFKAVKDTLINMGYGPQRCQYCYDSASSQVEHIRPKDLYPALTFVWNNYLYACDKCNGPKKNWFKVRSADGTIFEAARAKGTAIVAPAAGDPLLIDPRTEDPLDYLGIDIEGTFRFVPLTAKGTWEHERAEYTIDLLRLNRRDYLVKARKGAYLAYAGFLREYIVEKERGTDDAALSQMVNAMQDGFGHRAVWEEMKRSHTRIPKLSELFSRADEAFAW